MRLIPIQAGGLPTAILRGGRIVWQACAGGWCGRLVPSLIHRLPVLSRPASRMPLGPHYRCADQDDAAASHSGTADSLGCGRRDVRFIKPPDRPLRRRQGGDASCVGDRPARFAELDF